MVSIPGPLVFALALVVTVFILISGRAIIRFFFRLLRRFLSLVLRRILLPLGRTISRPLVRIIRRLRRAGTLAAPTKGAAPRVIGVAPYKVLVNVLEMNSLANAAMGVVPDSVKAMVKRSGIFFRYVNPNRAAELLPETLTIEAAQANVELVAKYYGKIIDGEQISPSILYEDSEEALIIEILRESDISFFWALRALRRNVSKNVVKILASMTCIVAVFPFVMETVIAGFKRPWSPPDIFLYSVVLAIFGCLFLLFRLTFYANSAWYNGQKLNYFVQTYFSRLLNQYKSATTAFSNILTGTTVTPDAVEANSIIWFINMHWISARQWLLELYVRNITFQIARDKVWHLITIPFLIFAFWVVLYLSWPSISGFLGTGLNIRISMEPVMNWRWPTVVPFCILLLIYFAAWGGLLRHFWDEIRAQGWPSFRDMDIKQAIEANIGPIVHELMDKRRNPIGKGGI